MNFKKNVSTLRWVQDKHWIRYEVLHNKTEMKLIKKVVTMRKWRWISLKLRKKPSDSIARQAVQLNSQCYHRMTRQPTIVKELKDAIVTWHQTTNICSKLRLMDDIFLYVYIAILPLGEGKIYFYNDNGNVNTKLAFLDFQLCCNWKGCGKDF